MRLEDKITESIILAMKACLEIVRPTFNSPKLFNKRGYKAKT